MALSSMVYVINCLSNYHTALHGPLGMFHLHDTVSNRILYLPNHKLLHQIRKIRLEYYERERKTERVRRRERKSEREKKMLPAE